MPATTPNLSIPYPLAADSVASYPALAKQQAEALEALHYDSGWVGCPYRPGFTSATVGKLQARRIGLVVYLRGGANGSIIGRNTFQRPRAEALVMLDKIIKIYQGKF